MCLKSLKGFHIISNEAFGFRSEAKEPGYNVVIKVGNCLFTAIRTTSNITSIPGAKTRSLPITANTSTRNSRLKSQRGVPIHTPIL